MKKLLLAILCFTIVALSASAKPITFNIVALVNGEILSRDDFENRVNAFLLTTKIPMNKQTEDMIYQRVLYNAVDEKLKLQEAEKNGVLVSHKDVNTSIDAFEKNNKVPAGGLKKILKDSNVSEEAFRSQIKSDIAWQRLVRKKMAGDYNLTQKEIEEALADAKKDLTTEKYMVSEIFVRKNKAKDLNILVENLRKDPRFELYAMQFSDNPSASNGGKLGWINKGKFLPKIEETLGKMKEGEVSNPIEINGDFYIVKLQKKFDPSKDEAPTPSEEEIRKFMENRKMEEYSSKYLLKIRQEAVIELRN